MKKLVCITSIALWMAMACTPDNAYDDYHNLTNAVVSPLKQQVLLQRMAHENDSIIEDEDWELSIPNAIGNPQTALQHMPDAGFDTIVPLPGVEPLSPED